MPLPEGEAAPPVETRPAITSCADARTNGLTNIGEDAALALGLPDHLDDDNDGIYCESASAARPTATPTPRATAAPSDYEPYVGGGQVGSATYNAEEDAFGVVRTTIHVVNAANEALYLRCWPQEDRANVLGDLEVYATTPRYGWSFNENQIAEGYAISLTRIDSADAWTGYWQLGTNEQTLFFTAQVERNETGEWKAVEPRLLAPQLVDQLADADRFLMRFTAKIGAHTAEWDVSDMSSTPAWANLTNCN